MKTFTSNINLLLFKGFLLGPFDFSQLAFKRLPNSKSPYNVLFVYIYADIR